jgi:hypothetical protein
MAFANALIGKSPNPFTQITAIAVHEPSLGAASWL